jgi:hypothetical protein
MIVKCIWEIYPAVEPDALVDIVPVGVVVPLDAVQKGSNSYHQKRREENGHRTTGKERTKRVVVPLVDTPKNMIAAFTW